MLSVQAMIVVEIFVFLTTVKLLGSTVYNCIKKFSIVLSASCFLLCIAGLWLSVLMSSMEKERIPAKWYVYMLVSVYLTLVVTVSFYSGKIRKNRLGNDCIVEAFAKMDMGLCYFDENGRIIMCNEFMHEFSSRLLGTRVLSGIEFQGELCRRSEDLSNPDVFEVSLDERMYQISIKDIPVRKMNLTEIKCADITELHKKKVELSVENQKLSELNEHLTNYGRIADKVIREKEILNAKIQIHDRFGELLLTARRGVEKKLPESEMDEIISFLKTTISCMGAGAEVEEDYYSELVKSSNSIGVNINLEGILPADMDKNKLFCMAIRECVTNTVKHAKGSNVYVTVENLQEKSDVCGKFRLTVKNDGKKPDYDKELGTGMSSLQTKIEKAGGSMEVRWLPEFELRIEL